MEVVTIGNHELLSVMELMEFVSRNRDNFSGWVVLQARDGMRYWSTSDGVIAIEYATVPDTRDYKILISYGQMSAAYWAVDINGEVEFFAEEKDDEVVTHVRADLFETTAVQLKREHPLVDFRPNDYEVGATADFTGIELRAAAYARRAAINTDADEECSVPVSLDRGKLQFFSESENDTTYVSSYRLGRSGSVALTVDACLFAQVVAKFEPTETIKVNFPLREMEPLVFIGEKYTVSLMPIATPRWIAHQHVVKVINETIGKFAACITDDDEHLLRRHGYQIHGKFISGEDGPFKFRVFGTLLDDVVGSKELFEEINEVNHATDFAKVVFVDCRVIVYYDLLASTLDGPELITAIEAVASTIEKFAATFSVVFGGDTRIAPEEIRWKESLETFVECEISPGKMITLNGSDAVADWPFPETVHVLSGYNPQGLAYDGSDINPQIARDVLDMGGRCVVGAEFNANREDPDPAIIAWGLTREQARTIGRRAGQDSIFEITADQLTLVQCCGTREESVPRYVPEVA